MLLILQRIAHPVFPCENCMGMAEYGCYCAANDASAPGMPPTLIQKMALWLLKRIFALAVCLLAICAGPARAAETGQVVAACGTPTGLTYPVPGLGNFTVDTSGRVCFATSIPAAGTAGAGYPPGATPVNSSGTGTTAGASATLAGVASKFTYICGYSVSPGSATTAITISVSVTGIANTFTEFVGAPVTAVGTTGLSFTRNFNPCVPASAVNTGINVIAGALGAGGVNQDVNAWGFQQ